MVKGYNLLLSVPSPPGRDRNNPFFRQARVTEHYATPQSELDRGIGQRVVLVTGTGEVRILPRR